MLLQLENTNRENISQLIEYARKLNLHLTLIDESENDAALPGKPLTPQQLNMLIERSRQSGKVSLKDAHQMIRDNFNAG